jgi:hypothetical protein
MFAAVVGLALTVIANPTAIELLRRFGVVAGITLSLAAVGKSVAVTHIAGCRSRFRLPIDMGGV